MYRSWSGWLLVEVVSGGRDVVSIAAGKVGDLSGELVLSVLSKKPRL